VDIGETPAGYSVQAQHPETGETIEESCANINDAVARAAELIRAGYVAVIKSTKPPA